MTRRRDELRRRTGRLAARLHPGTAGDAAAEPAVGDLWVQRTGAETAVQWCVVEVDAGRALAVPATPFIDDPEERVETEDALTGSPLVLHLDCPASFPLDRLTAGARSGRVPDEAVAEARGALGIAGRERSGAGPATGDRARQPRAGAWPLRLAASLVLVLLGALVGDLMRSPATVANVPVIPLSAEETLRSIDRDEPQPVTLPPAADHAVLWLSLGDRDATGPTGGYRLAIRAGGGPPEWIATGLEVQQIEGLPFLTAEVPARLLGPGLHQLELFGPDADDESPLRRYRLAVERPGPEPVP